MSDLAFRRGDTNEYTIAVTALDENGVAQPVSLVGADLWMTIKRDWDDPEIDAVIQKTIGAGIVVTAPPTLGIAVITIEPEDTENLIGLQRLVFDVQLKEADDTVTTVESGYVSILRDATRATV